MIDRRTRATLAGAGVAAAREQKAHAANTDRSAVRGGVHRPPPLSARSRWRTAAQFFAVTETEQLVGGDNWFWLDDNAKVLEFMSRPEVWRRFPEQTLEMLRFVRWMCQGPFMFRRVSTPRLERTGDGEGW